MRSHYCGAVTEQQLDQEVTLCGWVNRRRDHGGVIFIDLRDREGLVQVVFDPDRAEIFEIAEHVRNEYVLRLTGRVRLRPEGSANPDLTSGQIEILGLDLEVLNASETPRSSLTIPAFTMICACNTVTSTCVVTRCNNACACAAR